MRLRLDELPLPLDASDDDIPAAVARHLRLRREAVRACTLLRRSIDARARRGEAPVQILTVEVRLAGDFAARLPAGGAGVRLLGEDEAALPAYAPPLRVLSGTGLREAERPVVAGAGPAGLFAALLLAGAGARPLVLERGKRVEERVEDAARFQREGALDPESNLLYGEGGAGAFSDGKLTSRTKERGRARFVLETLVQCGAPGAILVEAEPHLGSDRLPGLLAALRERITALGGEFAFGARLEGFYAERGLLRGLRLSTASGRMERACETCLLATGHSAREIYPLLAEAGARLAPKPFALGVRLEVAQEAIDRARWGAHAGHPRLGAASFRLTRKASGGARACYSFCMCPGGAVMACASEPGRLTTNGMSAAARAGGWGNAAFLVPASADDLCRGEGAEEAAFACVAWLREWEERAFRLGGSDYSLPAESLRSFLANGGRAQLPEERGVRRARAASLREALPPFVSDTLARALPDLLRKLPGLARLDPVLYAAETRSTSPVRILRGTDGESVTLRGLYPAGEAAGYAGGIVSSAIDGLRAAAALMARIAPPRG